MKGLGITANVGVIGLAALLLWSVTFNDPFDILWGLKEFPLFPPIYLLFYHLFDTMCSGDALHFLVNIIVIIFCIFNIVAMAAHRALRLQVLAIIVNAFLLVCNLLTFCIATFSSFSFGVYHETTFEGLFCSTFYFGINLAALLLIRKALEEKKIEAIEAEKKEE